MKGIKVFYVSRPLKEVYPHATKWQLLKWRVAEFLKKCLRIVTWTGLTSGVVYGVFMAGQWSAPQYAIGANVIDNYPQRVEKLQNEVIDQIAKSENITNIPIVFDDNKAGTLSKKDKASIGCMQFKISTVQKYSKDLRKESLSDLQAVLLALDCDKAKALAKEVIFKVDGGLWNWSVATKEMGVKVEVIKELMK